MKFSYYSNYNNKKIDDILYIIVQIKDINYVNKNTKICQLLNNFQS